MIYFITLFLLYIVSEKIIKYSKNDTSLKKKTKSILKLFIIMFCILNIYGYCISNIIYSCIIIYIISYIKDDDIRDFISIMSLQKETFISDYIDEQKSFSRIPNEYRRGNPDVLTYKMNNSSYNNITTTQQIKSGYDKKELDKIKTILERKFWNLDKGDSYDSYERRPVEEEEEEAMLKTGKEIYKGLCYYTNKLFSMVGL